MKTTVEIPEALYRQAKIRAVETGQTLKQLVILSLRRQLALPPDREGHAGSFWDRRRTLREYEQAAAAGAYRPAVTDADVTDFISGDRDAR